MQRGRFTIIELLGLAFSLILGGSSVSFALYESYISGSLPVGQVVVWGLVIAIAMLLTFTILLQRRLRAAEQNVEEVRNEAKEARRKLDRVSTVSQIAAGTMRKGIVRQVAKILEDGTLDASFLVEGECLQDGVCYDKWGFGGPDTGNPVRKLQQTEFWHEGEGFVVQIEEDSPLFKRLVVQHGPPLKKGQQFTARWGYKWPKMVHTPLNPGIDTLMQSFPHLTDRYELEVNFIAFNATEINVLVRDFAGNLLETEIERLRSKEALKIEPMPDGSLRLTLTVQNPYLNCEYGIQWKPVARSA